MTRVTLVPAPALLALTVVTLLLPFGPDPSGAVILALLIVAPLEFVAFTYDFVARKDPVLSHAFAPRLVLHVVGSLLALFVLAIFAYIVGYIQL
jgi:hypothetical protein